MFDLNERLRRIQSGEITFVPRNSTIDALREFHIEALHFLEAEDDGFIERVSVHRESQTGERLYVHVHIPRGLTLRGMREIGVA